MENHNAGSLQLTAVISRRGSDTETNWQIGHVINDHALVPAQMEWELSEKPESAAIEKKKRGKTYFGVFSVMRPKPALIM
jgi:hypothetical protein